MCLLVEYHLQETFVRGLPCICTWVVHKWTSLLCAGYALPQLICGVVPYPTQRWTWWQDDLVGSEERLVVISYKLISV